MSPLCKPDHNYDDDDDDDNDDDDDDDDKKIVMVLTAMETAMSTVRNMPKGAGQQEGPQS